MLTPAYPPERLATPAAVVYEDRNGVWWCEVDGSLWRQGGMGPFHRYVGTWSEVAENGPLWAVPEATEVA